MTSFMVLFPGPAFCLLMALLAASNDDEVKPMRHLTAKCIGVILILFGIYSSTTQIIDLIQLSNLSEIANSSLLKTELNEKINNSYSVIYTGFVCLGLGIYSLKYKWTNRSKAKKFGRVLAIFGLIFISSAIIREFGGIGCGLVGVAILIYSSTQFPEFFNRKRIEPYSKQ